MAVIQATIQLFDEDDNRGGTNPRAGRIGDLPDHHSDVIDEPVLLRVLMVAENNRGAAGYGLLDSSVATFNDLAIGIEEPTIGHARRSQR